MKLLTHNMMQSHVKGITKRFPLLIKPADDGVRIVEQVKRRLRQGFHAKHIRDLPKQTGFSVRY